MLSLPVRLSVLVVATVLIIPVQPARAQFTGSAFATPYQPGFNVPNLPAPYYPNGFYNIYYDPWGGFMNGAANLINAGGTFSIQNQQSKLLGQEVERSKLDTKRKQFDAWMYERDHKPTLEDDRERERQMELRRSMNNPPDTEIWSGKALNDIFKQVQSMHSQGVPGPVVPLDPDVLSRINIVSTSTAGNFGLLKNGGKLTWPVPLRASMFQTDRRDLDQLMTRAVQEAGAGEVSFETITGLRKTLNHLESTVNAQTRSDDALLSFNDVMAARRYIKELREGVQTLQDANVGNFVTGKWSPKSNSVGELVQDMTNQGLKFGPATFGDQPSYSSLFQSMRTYANGMSRVASR